MSKKNLLAKILILVLVITSIPFGSVPAYAKRAADSEEEFDLSDCLAALPEYDNYTEVNGQYGYVQAPDENNAESLVMSGDSPVTYGSLPASYMTEKLPPLRDQNPYSTCWAHSCMGLAEVYMMNHPEAAKSRYEVSMNSVSDNSVSENTLDYSELQLMYFMYNSPVDPLGGTEGDTNGFVDTSKTIATFGGSLAYAENVLSGWVGAADESEAPYSNVSNVAANGLPAELAYKDVAHLKGYRNLSTKDDADGIKHFIMENGAVGLSYYDVLSGYNSSTNSFYLSTNKTGSTNHAVMVVGWDDNFPADSFKTTAPGNGAWIIRNSWTVSKTPVWGRQGYFYMSYYEPSLAAKTYAFEFENADHYDNCYLYDGGMVGSSMENENGVKGANVFTAKAGTNGEVIEAVSFVTGLTNQQYKVNVYLNDSERGTEPDSGYPLLEQPLEGYTDYVGLYTVKLDSPVYIAPGDEFTVVTELKALEGKASIGVEQSSPSTWKSYKSTASIKEGQSYIKAGTNAWKDLKGTCGNVRIKAYTVNVNEEDAQELLKERTEYIAKLNKGEDNPPGKDSSSSSSTKSSSSSSDKSSSSSSDKSSSSSSDKSSSSSKSSSKKSSSKMSSSSSYNPDPNTLSGNNIIKYEGTTVPAGAYRITYDMVGDKAGISNLPTVTLYKPERTMKPIKLPKPEREGYTFKGFIDTNGKKVRKITKKSKGDIFLTAAWTKNTYKIKYFKGIKGETKGVKGITPTDVMLYDSKGEIRSCGYVREGYTFAGWSDSPLSNKVVYKAGEKIKNLTAKNRATIKLYAVWTPIIDHIYADKEAPNDNKSGLLQYFEKADLAEAMNNIYTDNSMPGTGSDIYSSKWEKYGNYYMYNQLSNKEKLYWNNLEHMLISYLDSDEDLDEFTPYVIAKDFSNVNEVRDLTYRFIFSHPQYYFVHSYARGVYNEELDSCLISLHVYSDLRDGDKRRAATNTVFSKAESWEKQVNALDTDYEKVKKIYQLVCNEVVYNTPAAESFGTMSNAEDVQHTQSCYSTFAEGTTVCAGYAQAIQLMCDAVNIGCVFVPSETHAWNRVRVNDNWYCIDATWDDNESAPDGCFYNYFLKSSECYETLDPEKYPLNTERNVKSHTPASWIDKKLWPECVQDSGSFSLISKEPKRPEEKALEPVISYEKDDNGILVTISGGIIGTKYYYTMNSNDPHPAISRYSVYNGPFYGSGEIKAIAVKPGFYDSDIAKCDVGQAPIPGYSKEDDPDIVIDPYKDDVEALTLKTAKHKYVYERLENGMLKNYSYQLMIMYFSNYLYTGSNVKTNAIVYDITNNRVLSRGRQYKISYKNNKNAGDNAKLVITGLGYYKGYKSIDCFTILPVSFTNSSLLIPDVSATYKNGKMLKPSIELYLKGNKLGKNDYTINYTGRDISGNKAEGAYMQEGSYELKLTPGKSGNIKGEKSIAMHVNTKVPAKKLKVSYQKKHLMYDQPITPEVSVSYKKEPLKEGRDYEVSYHNNKSEGTGLIAITGLGEYTGTVIKKFTIR